SDHVVAVTLQASVVREPAASVREVRVVRYDRARITKGAEALARLEAEAADVPDRPDTGSTVTRPDGLCAILDHSVPVLLGDRHDGIHVCGLPVKVHGDDRLGIRGDQSPQLVRIDVARAPIDIAESNPRSTVRYRFGGSEKAGCRNDDFVAGADAESLQRYRE